MRIEFNALPVSRSAAIAARSLAAPLSWLIVAVSAGLAPCPAVGQTYRIDPEHSTAGFAVTHLGLIRERGRFNHASGTIIIDPAGVAGGSIEVVIDLASVDTGWDLRDAFLRSATMFDVTHYPVMRFHSRPLEYRERSVVAAEGDITLHGITRPLRLEVERLSCGRDADDGRDACRAMVTGRLKRREFGMAFAYPLIGDDVGLDFAITAFRIGDDAKPMTP